MCDICHRYTCPPGCPGYESKEEPPCVCTKCKTAIWDGETAFRIDEDTVWCHDCMGDARFVVR